MLTELGNRGQTCEVDVSTLFARAIRNIHENQSVSELFNA